MSKLGATVGLIPINQFERSELWRKYTLDRLAEARDLGFLFGSNADLPINSAHVLTILHPLDRVLSSVPTASLANIRGVPRKSKIVEAEDLHIYTAQALSFICPIGGLAFVESNVLRKRDNIDQKIKHFTMGERVFLLANGNDPAGITDAIREAMMWRIIGGICVNDKLQDDCGADFTHLFLNCFDCASLIILKLSGDLQ